MCSTLLILCECIDAFAITAGILSNTPKHISSFMHFYLLFNNHSAYILASTHTAVAFIYSRSLALSCTDFSLFFVRSFFSTSTQTHWYTSIKVFPFKLYFIHLLSLVSGAWAWAPKCEMPVHNIYDPIRCIWVSHSMCRFLNGIFALNQIHLFHFALYVSPSPSLSLTHCFFLLSCVLNRSTKHSETACDAMHDYTLQELKRLEIATAVTMK